MHYNEVACKLNIILEDTSNALYQSIVKYNP